MSRRSRWIGALLMAALAWAATRLGLQLATAPPVEIEVFGTALFVTGWSELVVLLILGTALVIALSGLVSRPPRWKRAAILVTLIVVAFFVATARPGGGRPEFQPLTSVEGLTPNDRQTLIVGLDGLTWKRLMPLIEKGDLPNFASLMRQGTYGVLHSYGMVRPSVEQFGYWSPVVWTTIATGVRAEVHGIDDFGIPNENGVTELAATYHRRAPAFWNLLTAFGGRVGVAGWWGSWPAEKVTGIVASSSLGLRGYRQFENQSLDDPVWVRDPRGLTYPEMFRSTILGRLLPVDLAGRVKREIFDLESFPLQDEKARRTFMGVMWQDRLYKRVARFMLTERDFDVTAVYLETPDYTSHLFWKYMAFPEMFTEELPDADVPEGLAAASEIVDNAYRLIDQELGQLLSAMSDDATVLVVSDHGFRTWPSSKQRADHSPFGVLIAKGPGIAVGRNLNLSLAGSLAERPEEALSVFDVLPTLMYLHDLPVSLELERSPQFRLFEDEYLETHPVWTVPSYGEMNPEGRLDLELDLEDQGEYEDRLRSLGYIN